MYTLKSIVQRGALVGAAASLAIATLVPAASVFADSLNPLTKRSLLLTSSAPGYQDTDGSGNSASNPNAWNGGEYYALPGSGPNGKKTGQTFTFNVSTDSREVAEGGVDRPIQAFTLQYCTTAAGLCQAPGNNTGDARPASDDRETNDEAHPEGRSDLDVVLDTAVMGTDFDVLLNGTAVPGVTWTIATDNKEDDGIQPYDGNDGSLTGKRNFITLSTASEDFRPAFDDQIQLVFKASDNNYITNPGADEFFVKIDTFDSDQAVDHVRGGEHNIDGGVTVANVMTESIHITTKVLETMSFSVGVDNPDLMPEGASGTGTHGSCDAMQIDSVTQNRLNLGNPNAEYSLETGQAFDVHSYWRLSSNSSGGATVYYSGDTLRNTVGDKIQPIEATNGALSLPGTEQFGLALVDIPVEDIDSTAPDFTDFPANHPVHEVFLNNRTWVYPLNVELPYASGEGRINTEIDVNDDVLPIEASFKFLESSKSVPEVIARNNDQVVSCATSKVRYVGNIAADTPAGVYTTKINFLAAPQY